VAGPSFEGLIAEGPAGSLRSGLPGRRGLTGPEWRPNIPAIVEGGAIPRPPRQH